MDIRYKKIFVGREEDLKSLSMLFDDCTGRSGDRAPPKVYSYLNAPGIGKTTLLKKFGERIEHERKGIYLYFSCKSRYESEVDLNRHLINTMVDLLDEKREYIEDYIKERSHPEKYLSRFMRIEAEVDMVVQTQNYRFFETTSIIDLLTSLIPVIFITDEIQRLQKINVDDEHTMLRSFADFLSDLLPSKVLLTISGTQYSIMSQIGHGIGSPLNGKIQSVVISPLKSQHIKQYISEFRKLYPDQPYTVELESYLLGFSGGHPRTIEKIVESFFTLRDATNFTENLTKKVNTLLSKSLLDREKIEMLKQLQDYEGYNEVKLWLLQGLDDNLRLNAELTEEDNALIFQLMTMGLIVMNGNSNYYITSYFHAVVILKTLTEPYEQFLYEVLNNRYFREMIGGYSGLGFTFEKIIFSSLILHGNMKNHDKQLIFNVKNLNKIETIYAREFKKVLDVDFRQDTLYSLPNANDVDGIFKSNGEIVLVQITTKQSGIHEKFLNFERVAQDLKVKGWFISLYESDMEETSHSKITMGSEVAKILGEKLYQRMLEVKEYLKPEI